MPFGMLSVYLIVTFFGPNNKQYKNSILVRNEFIRYDNIADMVKEERKRNPTFDVKYKFVIEDEHDAWNMYEAAKEAKNETARFAAAGFTKV